MRKIVCLTSVCTLLLLSCKPKETAVQCLPSGYFINQTVLDQCPDRMPGDVPHYAFELRFSGTEYIQIDNGFENFNLPYAKAESNCQFTIPKATLFGDMIFTLEGDSVLTLYDSAWTKVEMPSKFFRVDSVNLDKINFHSKMNACLLAGKYSLNGQTNVEILPDGRISGLDQFNRYAICYAGDCLEDTDPPARTLTLTNVAGQSESFVFQRSANADTLQFLRIGPEIPDQKGGRAIGEIAYALVRAQ